MTKLRHYQPLRAGRAFLRQPARVPRAPKGYKFTCYPSGGSWHAHVWKVVGKDDSCLEITGPSHGTRARAIAYLREQAAELRANARRPRWAELSREQKLDAIATVLTNHDSSPPRYWATCRKFSAPLVLDLVEGEA